MGAGRAILIATLVAALLSACGQAGASVRPAPGSVVAAAAPGGPLQSVDCVNATTCWAVGSNGDSPTRAQAVIEEYTGGGWAMATTAAAPAGHGYALLGVSCPSSGECWAVGTDSGPGGTVPLIEHHAGGSWSIVRAAPVAGSNVAGLRGVACAGSTDCWAVGSFGASPTRPLVEHFDGNRWTLAQPPSTPEAGDASLNAVTCQRDGSCWTVGVADAEHSLAARLDGGRWMTVAAAVVGGESATLSGVSCTAVPECWAVGSITTRGVRWPLIEGNDGSGWTVVTTPRPLFSSTGWLTGVSCARAQACWAAGGVRSFAGTERPLVQLYDGSAWRIINPPAHSATALVTSVACSDEDDCWTVGSCDSSTSSVCGGSGSLIEMYDTVLPDGH